MHNREQLQADLKSALFIIVLLIVLVVLLILISEPFKSVCDRENPTARQIVECAASITAEAKIR